MCRIYIFSSVKITHIYCYSITRKKCPAHVLPMYIFAVQLSKGLFKIFLGQFLSEIGFIGTYKG